MNLFISYRRDDTQEVARSMKTFLDQIPRIDDVFLDFDEIGIGEDFEESIRAALADSSHCLVLIGDDWAGARDGAKARIFDPEDFVRREAALALASEAKLIPVLVDDVEMPKASDLPSELKRLPKINAFSLRTSHFNDDMDDLLDAVFGEKAQSGSRWKQPELTVTSALAKFFGGLTSAAALILVVAVVSDLLGRASGTCGSLTCRVQQVFDVPYRDSVNLLVGGAAIILALGALLPFALRLLKR